MRARAPGRVCVLGEHTDYNGGLALAMAIEQGVTVEAHRLRAASQVLPTQTLPSQTPPNQTPPNERERVVADAADLEEHDEFPLADPGKPGETRGWRAFVRGMVAELRQAGLEPVGASLRIEGDVPRGAGLSSSAALEVALALALIALAGGSVEDDDRQDRRHDGRKRIGRTELARLCSRVENEWAGARTGLLDQLSSLYGCKDEAMRIDFQTLAVEPVPMELDGWRLVTLDTGERRENATSGYNERRQECARACELLGVASLREVGSPGTAPHDPARDGDAQPRVDRRQIADLPESLRRRVKHVMSENRRVDEGVAALRSGDLPRLGGLLNEANRSLRDDMEVSTPTVEKAVQRMLDEGAAGARLLGGGFGGSVLGLLPPDVKVPEGARAVRPCAGARVVSSKPARGTR